MKKHDYKNTCQILRVIDDVVDNPGFTRNNELLHPLYARGRHSCTSTIPVTQVYKAISHVMGKNVTH